MPSFTATVHQLLRYFFVGAFAVVWCVFLLDCGGGPLDRKLARVIDKASQGGALAATGILITGAFIYCVHRTVFYPCLHRLVIARVAAGPALGRRCSFWPWGRTTPVDVNLQVAFWMPQGGAERERFVGWASELHLLYVAAEVTLASWLWPGWGRAIESGRWQVGLALLVVSVGCFTWAWDLQLVQLERCTAERTRYRTIVHDVPPANERSILAVRPIKWMWTRIFG